MIKRKEQPLGLFFVSFFVFIFLFNANQASAIFFERPLTIGSSGQDVLLLQQKLKDLGFFNYPTTTGYFGSVTEKSVQEFQKATGLVPKDSSAKTPGFGFVGPKTRLLFNLIFLIGQNKPSTENITTPKPYFISGVISGSRNLQPDPEPEDPIVDTTPPVISTGLPSGEQVLGTTSVSLQVTTDEDATCKYGTVADTDYDSIAGTFSSTGGTSHSQSISSLSNGSSYTYYIRCSDESDNATTSDYTVSFSVDSLVIVALTSTGVSEPVWDTFEVQVTFSEAVTDFVLGDITVTNGTAGNLNTADNIVYTVDITPDKVDDLEISVAADTVTPENSVSNTLSVTALVPELMGDVFTDDFDRASLGSNYVDSTPNATVTVTSNELVMTKANGTNPFSNVIYYSELGAWGLNNKYVNGIHRYTSFLTSDPSGSGVGWQAATQTFAPTAYMTSFFASVVTNTSSAAFKKIMISRYNTVDIVNTFSSTAFAQLDLGDRIEIEFSEVNFVLTATAWNLTKDPSKSNPITVTVQLDYQAGSNGVTNYYPAMFSRGGNTVFEEFTAGSSEYKNTEWLILGDGVLQGHRANSHDKAQPNQLNIGLGGVSQSFTKLTNSAVRPSTTDVVLSGLPLLQQTNPRRAFIRLGQNDIESSRGGSKAIGATLALSDLQSLVSGLMPYVREGITLCTPVADHDDDFTDFADDIISTFSGVSNVKVIDCFRNTYTSAGTPFLKVEWEDPTTPGKLNELAQSYVAGQPDTYSDTNFIILNWEE